MTEAEVETACRELVAKVGGEWENYSQRRESKVAVLPDARVVFPRWEARVWLELKKTGGKMTRDQHTWIRSENAAGGLAACVDDVQQLAVIIEGLRRRTSIAKSAIRQYCVDITELAAKRGYRGERKDGTPFRKRIRRARPPR